MKKIIFFVIIIISSISYFTINSYADNLLSIDRLTLRESFQSNSKKAEPAYISFSSPTHAKDYFNLSFAIGYRLPLLEQYLKLNPFFEYKRNNQIEKEANIIMSGLAYNILFFDINSDDCPHLWSPILNGKTNYKYDYELHSGSIQSSLYFTAIFRGRALNPLYFFIPNMQINFWDIFKFSYSPNIGLEYENVYDSSRSISRGNILRGYAHLNVSIFPLPIILNHKLELLGYIYYRYDFMDEVKADDRSHLLYKASAMINVYENDDDGDKVGISFDYIYGEDPTNGFQDQELFQLSIRAKF